MNILASSINEKKDIKIMIPKKIEGAIFGFMVSHILFTIQKLGIFKILSQLDSQSVDELAARCQLPKESLARLLVAAVSSGFLQVYKNKYSIADDIKDFFYNEGLNYCNERFAHYEKTTMKLFHYLEDAIRENNQQWRKIDPGFNPERIFDSIYSDLNTTESFLKNMWALGFQNSIDLCKKFSLKDFNHLVDLGGATGSFTIPALLANENLSATIFDHEKVKQFAEKKICEYNLQERLTFNAGDFFKQELPPGDVYSLGYILSDWTDDQGTALLIKIFNRLPKGGVIIILEKVFNDDKSGPFTTAMMDLNMLLETYGKHRTYDEYKNWLVGIGFVHCQIVQSQGEKHMIVAIK